MSRLHADHLEYAYSDQTQALRDLSLHVPDGEVTAVVGPNGCGKSTLLRSLVRLIRPQGGLVLLDGEAIHKLRTTEVATRIGLLSQAPSSPFGLTVEELVQRGRHPHRGPFSARSVDDRRAVESALELAGVAELRERFVDELSGGQRQRAWIALTLAQNTPILLLDEPTTFLDIAHRMEVLQLLRRLNRSQKRTIVIVLHDVNEAAEIADNVVAMRNGIIESVGPPDRVLRASVLSEVFGIECREVLHPQSRIPHAVPASAFHPRKLAATPGGHALELREISAGYDGRPVLDNVSLAIPRNQITAIVGPNACGKSTLLRILARLLEPWSGSAELLGRPLVSYGQRELARSCRMLEQEMDVPEDMPVEDLVATGRFPYQRWYRQWSKQDRAAVVRAMDAADISHLRARPIGTLSGGQRRRAWVAMALAQQTEALLLDEPTTFLDMAHQIEVLDLIWARNRLDGRTTVLVLHDLSQACRYADNIVVMNAGTIVTEGAPEEIVTPELVAEVFNVESSVLSDPHTGRLLILPHWGDMEQSRVHNGEAI